MLGRLTVLLLVRSVQWRETVNVLLLSTSYPSNASDWRGVFMRHMVGAIARVPDIQLSVWAPPGELPETARDVTTPHEAYWLAKLMAAGGISHLLRSGGVRAALAPLKLIQMMGSVYRRHADVDVYHVNWLQCALPLPSDGKPALITVLGNDLNLLRLPLMRQLLRRTMRGRRVAICPNAEWMEAPLRAAFGDLAEIVPVSFGIDPCWYAVERRPRGEALARWLAVTRLTANKLGPLFEWSQDFFSEGGHELHLFGPMQEEIHIPGWVHYHGAATPLQLAIEWFPGASGLITLSRHAEGRPQVMLEAMAAGLPIIASRTPAHANIVTDERTGILCDSTAGYRNALDQLQDVDTNTRFGAAARSWALEKIGTWDDCAQRYTRIYRHLLGRDTGE